MNNLVIIADSGPLIALAIINKLELLHQLYARVIVPKSVWYEVTVQGNGMPGANDVSLITWFEIQEAAPEILKPLSILVDAGEAEAIALAQQQSENCIVLLDDAHARRVAERLGVERIGTLGILRKAKKSGLVTELRPAIDLLQKSGIYIRQTLVDAIGSQFMHFVDVKKSLMINR